MTEQILSFADAVRLAAALHQQGRLEDALAIYGQLQASQPQDPNLNALVGVLLAQLGRQEEGVPFLNQALTLDPNNIEAAHNLAHALAAAGRTEEAAEAANHLGQLWFQRQDFERAREAYIQALEWSPSSRAAAANLGATLQTMGRHAESIKRLTALLQKDLERAEAHNHLGNAQLGAGNYRAAAASFRRALALRPDYSEAESNLGLARAWLGESEMAHGSAPAEDADADANENSRTSLETAACLVTLGNARQAVDPLGDIESCYRKALTLQPDFPAAHWNLSLCLLLRGDFERGWAEHEWRWRWAGFGEAPRPFAQPIWRGEPPEAVKGTLLVTAEQGLGDTLQFVRYLPLLAEQGYEVTFEAQAPLFTLLWYSLGGSGVRVIPRAGSPAQVYDDLPFAAHVPLLSLPERFKTRLDTIPAAAPYLHADPFRRRLWRERLEAAAAGRLKVGLVWRGRPQHARDADRSMSADRLKPLLATPGVAFFSLHKDPPGRPADDPPGVTPLGGLFNDFADAAAAMVNLDLVITVDTAAAHLAGGLRVPVWTLLPFSPDWRWMLGRNDSPWHPSMTLFRQPAAGDWESVVAAAAARLATLDPAALTRLEGCRLEGGAS